MGLKRNTEIIKKVWDGKNLDYLWVYEPTRLTVGEQRELRYEIVLFGNGFELSERK